METETMLYQSEDAHVQLNVLVENETVWLTQAQIGKLFGVQKAAISKHLKNIFVSGELRQEAVVSILETTEKDIIFFKKFLILRKKIVFLQLLNKLIIYG